MKWSLAILCTWTSPYLVNAAPSIPARRAVSQSVVDQLYFYEQYAAAAYCPNNNEPGSTVKISCEFGNCPQVQNAGAVTTMEFRNQGRADATGFVAVDKANKVIVLSYRGSRSIRNWLGNAAIGKSAFLCSGCEVHDGFLSSWTSTRDAVLSAVQSARSANPGFSVVVTGHSLGGAIATIAASELRTRGIPLALYTYGSPMVGNDAYAQFVTNQGGGNFRVTHQIDLVPKLPGYEIFGYRHVSPQYWITSGLGRTVSANDVQVSYGTKDTAGNYGAFGVSIIDHLWYFNNVAICTPDLVEFY